MKTLHLLRHAKSDWSDAGLSDHDRPLNKRGRRARALVAAHVEGWAVGAVICSTALRARQSAAPVVEALACPVRFDDRVYGAGVPELLAVVRELPDEIGAALIVGHNPGMEDLAWELCGWAPRFPTAALCTIELAVDRWGAVVPSCGRLAAHVTPGELGPGPRPAT